MGSHRVHTGALIMAGFFKSIGNFFTGTPAKRENVSTLRPEQEGLYNQLQSAARGPGAGGAYGTSADYYRNLLSDNSQDYNAFAAPQLRQYNEDIVPGLSEQFAGMGAGGLSSSGFRNAQVQGATDLSERLGAIRANLRQQGAAGLQNIGQAGLGNFSQNMETDAGHQGFLPMAFEAAGKGLTSGVSAGLENWFGGRGNRVAKNSNAYGPNGPQASPPGTGRWT